MDRLYKNLVKLIVLGEKKEKYYELFYDKELITVKRVTKPRCHKMNSLSPKRLLYQLKRQEMRRNEELKRF